MKTLLVFILSVCVNFAMASVSPEVAYSQVTEGRAVLIDVRELEEVKVGMIKLAVLFSTSRFDPENRWKPEFEKIVGNKAIFLYCRSGTRAEKVRVILKAHGIESVNLGGFDDLKKILPSTETP